MPVIFILSVGADPTGMLLDFADSQDPEKHVSQLHIISLGQGQGPKAEALIEKAKKTATGSAYRTVTSRLHGCPRWRR